MSRNIRQNRLAISGATIYYGIDGPFSADQYDEATSCVARLLLSKLAGNLPPRKVETTETRTIASIDRTFRTTKGVINLSVRVTTHDPVNEAGLYAVLEHSLADVHQLVDIALQDDAEDDFKSFVGERIDSLLNDKSSFIGEMLRTGQFVGLDKIVGEHLGDGDRHDSRIGESVLVGLRL